MRTVYLVLPNSKLIKKIKKPKPYITLWQNRTGIFRTRGKCRKHELLASVFYISGVFLNVRSDLSKCNTRLRLLHLLYDTYSDIKAKKRRFLYVLYSDKTWILDQSKRAQGPIYIIILGKRELFICNLCVQACNVFNLLRPLFINMPTYNCFYFLGIHCSEVARLQKNFCQIWRRWRWENFEKGIQDGM